MLSIVVEIAADAINLALEEIHEGPKEVWKIGFEAGVEKQARQSFDGGLKRKMRGIRRGQGTRLWFVIIGAIAVQSEFIEKMRGQRLGFLVRSN